VTLLYCTCPRRPPAPPSRRPSPPLTWRASTTCLDSNSGEEALGLPALPHTPRGTGHSRPGQEGIRAGASWPGLSQLTRIRRLARRGDTT
jgi:hypothetical protein